MPTFAFSGRTRSGENVTGERVGDTMDAVVSMLRREQVLVTKVTPVKAKAEAAPKAGKLGKGVAPKSLAIFVRQFSVMIDAGLPLVQCLEILGTQEEDKNFAATILQTRADVENGQSLATLHLSGKISLETALLASSNRDELQEMINRGVGVVAGAGMGQRPLRPTAVPPIRR